MAFRQERCGEEGGQLTLLKRCTRPERSSCIDTADEGQRAEFIPSVGGLPPPPPLLAKKIVL